MRRLLAALPLLPILLAVGAAADAGAPAPMDEAALAAWGRAPASLAIRARVGDGRWQARRAIAAVRGQAIALSVVAPEGAAIRWYVVVPDLTRNYANAAPPWEADAYTWRGMDRIGWFQIELAGLAGRREVAPFAGGAIAEALAAIPGGGFYRADVGTFRFAADVVAGGRTRRTPGAIDATDRGISARALRVTVRGDASYLGALEGFYNVAGLFGSTTYQAAQHIGADCADILTAALAEWRGRRLGANANVQRLTAEMRTIARIAIAAGVPSRPLRWGEEIAPGDFIAVKYEGFAKFVHVGALARDEDGDGALSAGDAILHAGPDPLHETLLGDGAFDGEVVVLRPRGRAR